MSEVQRKLAFEMLTQSLSAKGLKKTQDIMKLNGNLAELANNFKEYGTIVLQDEQSKGLKLIKALNAEQQSQAIVMNKKDGNNNLSEAYKDNIVLDYAGIPASKLDAAQKQLLMELIEEYVGNMRDGHAKIRMSEVFEHFDRTHFAWIGGATAESVYYYRVHSPVILIEFDHQRRVAPFRTTEPTRDHIHTVVRTPNGNDYGKDVLRQHYKQHAH